MNISEKIATDYDTNLPPEKLKAATQNEQNDGWLIVKNRPTRDIRLLATNDGLSTGSGHPILTNPRDWSFNIRHFGLQILKVQAFLLKPLKENPSILTLMLELLTDYNRYNTLWSARYVHDRTAQLKTLHLYGIAASLDRIKNSLI